MNPVIDESVNLKVDGERLLSDMHAISAFGATAAGGVNRPSFSPDHLAARAWFQDRAKAAGLEVQADSAGNCSVMLRCGRTLDSPVLLLGSHLDSVPDGGRFDGVLGVLAGLEVLRVVQGAGISLPFHLEVIDFSDEEGTLVGILGSSAITGILTLEDLEQPRGGREALEEGLKRAGLTIEGLLNARRDLSNVTAYLELHIEQGALLEQAGVEIGIVSSIVGVSSYRLTFQGRADHAGTSFMEKRRDAGLGASDFTLSARSLVLREYPGCVVNVGNVQYFPGAFNIVPALAVLSLEFRSPDMEEFEKLERDILNAAGSSAEKYGLGFEAELLGRHDPTPMHAQIQEASHRAANALSLSSMPLPSRAAHDAQPLARMCPSGMIFVPSSDGVSHSPQEYTRDQDCINGANVLLRTVLELAKDQE